MPTAFQFGSQQKTGTVHEAAEEGEIAVLERHVQVGMDMGYPARETLRKRDGVMGATPLHYAAENGHLHVLKVNLSTNFNFKLTADTCLFLSLYK